MKKDKIMKNLEKNVPAIQENKPISLNKDVKDDYDFSRRTYKDLITVGTRSLDVLAELARESEHPRAFEVLSKSINFTRCFLMVTFQNHRFFSSK